MRKLPRSERIDVPYRFFDLAQRRTEFLFLHATYGDMPLRRVLACAYMQGLSDAGQALEKQLTE
jgi:hypothetical protein